MNLKKIFIGVAVLLLFIGCTNSTNNNFVPITHSSVDSDNLKNGYLVYHPIKTDGNGKIMPWYNDNKGLAYDHILNLVWNFWDTMRIDKNGLPYYMNHQVWEDNFNDGRGIAGSQFEMALSSEYLYYAYTGNQRVMDNMTFIADYYLTHSLSAASDEWPHMPYPYNTLVYSGIYDGDMILGKNFTQPDKAGGFAYELVNLYKMCGNERYLSAAVDIANTLARHTKNGDNDNSPLPFKVNAVNGATGLLIETVNGVRETKSSCYSSNWCGTLQLFETLQSLGKGETIAYKNAHTIILNWMKTYPIKTNKWGPFFEDVFGWSDAQINAITCANYMMLHPALFPNWKEEVKEIYNWVYKLLGNKKWEKYGVTVVNEQTAYAVEGNSHSVRQAASELQYSNLTGEKSRLENAIRLLNWATYSVDDDGKNQYPNEQIWMSDGYADYIRHFIRAMGALPSLAPDTTNHLLSSTSVVKRIEYYPNYKYGLWGIAFSEKELKKGNTEFARVRYFTYDKAAVELLRLVKKPTAIKINGNTIAETANPAVEGWIWQPFEKGGTATIQHTSGEEVIIIY